MALVEALTIDDFERLPHALAKNHELIDGELVDVSGNSIEHNWLRDCFIELLRRYVRDHGLGRVVAEQEYAFGENAHGPDVSFFGPGKMRLVEPQRRVQPFVPDLAIEVISDNDKYNALVKKLRRYVECGTREAWMFSVEHRQAHRFTPAGVELIDENGEFKSDLIPGFSIRLKDLFDQA